MIKESEKLPLFLVWKEGNVINATLKAETSKFELYAFLEFYLEKMKQEITSSWGHNDENI